MILYVCSELCLSFIDIKNEIAPLFHSISFLKFVRKSSDIFGYQRSLDQSASYILSRYNSELSVPEVCII